MSPYSKNTNKEKRFRKKNGIFFKKQPQLTNLPDAHQTNEPLSLLPRHKPLRPVGPAPLQGGTVASRRFCYTLNGGNVPASVWLFADIHIIYKGCRARNHARPASPFKLYVSPQDAVYHKSQALFLLASAELIR